MIAPQVPVYVWFTPFRIAQHTDSESGKKQYRAEWTRGSMAGRPACPWRDTREGVRSSMANLYADVIEVKE